MMTLPQFCYSLSGSLSTYKGYLEDEHGDEFTLCLSPIITPSIKSSSMLSLFDLLPIIEPFTHTLLLFLICMTEEGLDSLVAL